MLTVSLSPALHQKYPDGCIGILEISGVDNARRPTPLDPLKREIEAKLRSQYAGFSRADFLGVEELAAYERYYKKFEKTYHVQLQLESIVLKNKSLPNVSPLVDANFMAEVESLILTAGHDVATLLSPVRIDVTDGSEPFTQMNGSTRILRPDDMCMADQESVVCTIIYGQDQRTPITERTTHALYVSYAPPGVGKTRVQKHLEQVSTYVKLFSPGAKVEQLELY